MNSRFLQFKLLALAAVLAFTNARNLPNITDAPWESKEWMRCHGQPCSQWERVQEKLTQIKIQSLQGEMGWEGEVNSSLINSTDNLAECIWLTEYQCDKILQDLKEGNSQESDNRRKRKATFFDNNAFAKWTMPVPWKMDGSQNANQQATVRAAFKHWADHTCIQFRELNTYEQFRSNHIIVTGKGTGCHSYIGRVSIIPQQLNLQAACLSEFGIPVHEIGHALGLWHEQQRSDREQAIRILWQNIGSYQGQYYKHKTNNLVPYDTSSVMHYSAKDGSKNGRNVMETLDPSQQHNMGQRVGLSFLDAKIINLIYCKDVCRGRPLPRRCASEGYQDPKDCSKCRCPDGLGGTYCEQVAPSNNPTCGGEISLGATAKIFESPGYRSPRYYNLNTECNWLIKVPVGHKIRLRFLGEFGVYCHYQKQCFHWVEVRHSRNLGVQAGRYCCSQTPTDIITSDSNQMLVVFRSKSNARNTRSRRGFQFSVEAVPRITTFTTTTPATTTSSVTTSTTTTRYTTTMPTTTTKPVKSDCKRLDVTLILDGSIRGINWWNVLGFLTSTVSRFEISPSQVRVAMVTYGHRATVEFPLTHYSTMENLIREIQRTTSNGGGSDMAQGIKITRERVFNENRGDRKDVRNVAVLVTNGFSGSDMDSTIAEAEISKYMGMEIYLVGIGNKADMQLLKAIAYNPEDVIYMNNFDDLAQPANTDKIVRQICTNEKTSSKPVWSCNFETANDPLCGLTQYASDHFDWTLSNRSTTPSFGTGPDSAYEGRRYIYIEASYPRKRGDAAFVLLPGVQTSGKYCLSFHYHMYGEHINVLSLLKQSNDNSLSSIWYRVKDQGNLWHLAKVEVQLEFQETVGFLGIRGTNYAGDIALDQIELQAASCGQTTNAEAGFNIAADPDSAMQETLDYLVKRKTTSTE